jgi:phage terminase small subunit
MRGRKPQPTALKLLNGTQACRINRNEPKYPLAWGAAPPKWLGRYGRSLWRRLAPLLVKQGVLTVIDLPALEMLADEWDNIRRNPQENGARDRLRKWMLEFGLTPSARSRISSMPENTADELTLFLNSQKGS